jgi:hypothetical protein
MDPIFMTMTNNTFIMRQSTGLFANSNGEFVSMILSPKNKRASIFQRRCPPQIHHDSFGNKVIILEGINVCSIAWCTIMDVSRAIYFC